MMGVERSSSYWASNGIRLRAMEPADWEAYAAWNQDDEIARNTYFVPLPRSHEAMRRWAEEESIRKPDADECRFVLEDMSGAVIGDLTTHHCDRRNGTFSYGVCIKQTCRRRGYAKAAITFVMRYYFRELRYQKVTVSIYDFNEPSIRLHEALGFQPEGRLRRMGYTNGAYFDHLVYGLTVEELDEIEARSRP
jgi:RimJ/RimL family protein N-acetyltransferase